MNFYRYPYYIICWVDLHKEYLICKQNETNKQHIFVKDIKEFKQTNLFYQEFSSMYENELQRHSELICTVKDYDEFKAMFPEYLV